MTAELKSSLVTSLQAAATLAGLVLVSATEGSDFHGQPTAVFELGLPNAEGAGRTLRLELTEGFEFDKPELLPAMTAHLAGEAKRLRNPRPECYVTLGGLPIAFGKFQWPFHSSTSGADTHIVHGEMQLADGGTHNLHAKLAASVTLTFAEIVPAMEQPYADSFVYNAVRKTVDYGQLELVKSGNRQPVPVTTRYYSRWQKKFFFTDTDDQARQQFLMTKVFWLSGILGSSQPVWIADPRDAQYLNTTPEELIVAANALAAAGLVVVSDGAEFAAATTALLAREPEFRARLEQAFALTKPSFNEEMRHGHTNM